MATERLSMRKIREILRHKWVLGRSHREVAASLGISVGAVSAAEHRARDAGLDWSTVEGLDETALEARLYGTTVEQRRRPLPDPALLHAERKKPGVTLELLHHEYLERHPDGYAYTQFCEYYRRWCGDRRLSMRQVHVAGEKLFVDYAGKKPQLTDPNTGAAGLIGDDRICKVSIVGIGMRSHVGVASKMFAALSVEGINIQMITTSEIKTSVVIDEKYMELAVRALHKAFDLDQEPASS